MSFGTNEFCLNVGMLCLNGGYLGSFRHLKFVLLDIKCFPPKFPHFVWLVIEVEYKKLLIQVNNGHFYPTGTVTEGCVR